MIKNFFLFLFIVILVIVLGYLLVQIVNNAVKAECENYAIKHERFTYWYKNQCVLVEDGLWVLNPITGEKKDFHKYFIP